MNNVLEQWKKDQLFDRINAEKQVFKEPDEASKVSSTLQEYSEAIMTKNGGLICCTIGGKLSEGINFSDNLARFYYLAYFFSCVFVIGLPFPNIGDVVLNEKKRYIKEFITQNKTISSQEAARYNNRANEYFEDLCMNSLNQAIGRAIRHINDYAVIILADKRYQRDSIKNKLPHWMIQSERKVSSFFEWYRFTHLITFLAKAL